MCAQSPATGAGELVRQALDQKRRLELDNAGFSELVLRFQDMAFGYACAITGDPNRSQDIVQESFLRAWEHLHQLNNPDAFPGWFRQIVRRAALDLIAREPHTSLSVDAEAGLASTIGGPMEDLLARESAGEIQEAISGLPETLRTSVVLYYVDGYTHQEIADFLEISLSAVKKRMQRGRDQMRRNLEERIRRTVGEMKPSNDGRLLATVNIYTNFSIAGQLGQITLLEAMLVDGIDVNELDAMGRSLLHWAVESAHVDAVELLLRNGADPDVRDHEGRTPRDIASEHDDKPILGMLDERR